jgi:hypothetical protein
MALNRGERAEINTGISILVDVGLQRLLDLAQVRSIRTSKFVLTDGGEVSCPKGSLECADDYGVMCGTEESFYNFKFLGGNKPSLLNADPSPKTHLKFMAQESRIPGEEWQQKGYAQKAQLEYVGFMSAAFHGERDHLGFGQLLSKCALAHYQKHENGKRKPCPNLVEVLGADEATYLVQLCLSGIARKRDGHHGSFRTVIVRDGQLVTLFNPSNKGDALLVAKHTVLETPSRSKNNWGRFLADGRTLPWAPQLRLGKDKGLLLSTLCDRNGSVELEPLSQDLLECVYGFLKQQGRAV